MKLWSAVAVTFFAVGAQSVERVPFSEGRALLANVGSPVLSPDGRSVYVSVRRADAETPEEKTRVVRLDFGSGEVDHPFETAPENLAPDGKSFVQIGSEEGVYGLRVFDATTGAGKLVAPVYQSDHFLGHNANKNPVWSPDSTRIAYAAGERVPVPDDSGIHVITRTLYKTRTALTDNVETHIFIADVSTGEAKQLTDGPFDDHSLSWHPDGSRIAFISNRTADPDNNYNNDIWTVEVTTGAVTQITETPGTEFEPKWSPDGRYLVYQAGVRPVNTTDSQAENPRLWVRDEGDGSTRELAADLDRRISSVQWAPDSRAVYFIAVNHGARWLYRTPVSGGKTEQLVSGDVTVGAYAVSGPGNRIVYRRATLSDPGELWTCTLRGGNHRQLTHYQDEFKSRVAISIPETIWFKSSDGLDVQGWLMRPARFEANRKYPMILTIHGGPHGAYGYSFSERNQEWAEKGYAVLYINPRGSTGYGQAFVDGTINNWGGGDYQDLMAGVDYVLAANPWIDSERLGVTGGSYGGYMTNWVITQTDRFKAAVSVASVSNLVSFYGTSLYQLLIETEFPGKTVDNFDLLWHWSPLSHVRHVTTPTLFIHGESDNDVPITQAEEMYIALKKVGVEAMFVRYAGEGHGFQKPANIADRTRRTDEWLDRFLRPSERPARQ